LAAGISRRDEGSLEHISEFPGLQPVLDIDFDMENMSMQLSRLLPGLAAERQ